MVCFAVPISSRFSETAIILPKDMNDVYWQQQMEKHEKMRHAMEMDAKDVRNRIQP